ncbi:MAG: DegV family protein [Thermincola sp.]|jgi:DegV family protein with EDD domain|nr:DegV family protein [Thermincola sp.]MDT3701558.1 DegV family protein [Thermincola sp.]
MGKVRIVSDSTADIPGKIINDLGIIVVPLKVSSGGEVYRDGVDITSKEVVSRMLRGDIQPTTSQPSPGEFVAVYENLIAKGETVISIHLSGKLSGTVQSAQTAKSIVDNRELYVVDSKSASMGLGLIVIAAAKAAAQGMSARGILDLIKKKIENHFILFFVDTLEYLEKGGRIGKANAFLGTLLKIKPILTVDEEGQVTPLEKVRGKIKAFERIASIVAERTDNTKSYECALLGVNDAEAIEKLRQCVAPVLNCDDIMVAELGPVIVSHTGPGTIGIVVSPKIV